MPNGNSSNINEMMKGILEHQKEEQWKELGMHTINMALVNFYESHLMIETKIVISSHAQR